MIVILWHDGSRNRKARAVIHNGDIASARRRATRECGPDETVTFVGRYADATAHA